MAYDGPEPLISDAVAAGPKDASGPAGVPPAAPAPHHHLTFLAARPGRTRSGVSAAPRRSATHPARSRNARVLAGTRAAKEAPMA